MRKIERYVLMVAVGLSILGSVGIAGLPDGKLRLWYLDIGQGDAILGRLPAGEWLLIDGGPDNSILEKMGGIMPFYEREIDLVVLSHPHADHLNGLVEVFKRYSVKNLLLTGVKYDYLGYDKLLEVARMNGVKIWLTGKEDFLLGKTGFDIIYPHGELNNRGMSNVNNSSIVFRLIVGDFKAFFSGDLEMEKEKDLALENFNLQADVLKAGHHGSKTSNTSLFLEKIKPQWVIISCGVGNKFNHPFAGTLERIQQSKATIYRTDLDGTIDVSVASGGRPIFSVTGKNS